MAEEIVAPVWSSIMPGWKLQLIIPVISSHVPRQQSGSPVECNMHKKFRSVVPEAGIKGRYMYMSLHPTLLCQKQVSGACASNYIPQILWNVIACHCPWYLLCKKQVSGAGASNYIPQILWNVITCPCPWYLLCKKQVSGAGASNYIPQLLWNVIACPCPWYLLCKKQVSGAGASNYIPQILWNVIACHCPWYLLLTQHSWIVFGTHREPTGKTFER